MNWSCCLWLIPLGFLFSGCQEKEAVQIEPEQIRELNEIPIGQMRVMLKGFPGDWRNDSDASKGLPEPPTKKAVPTNVVPIDLVPPDRFRVEGSLQDVIASRRSRREFSLTPLDLDELSFLVWSAQGVTDSTGYNPSVNRVQSAEASPRLRAAPSAGARYPLETYLVVNQVEGLAPGIYRYLPESHQLISVLKDPDTPSRIQAACYGNSMVRDAAMVVIFAAVPYRTEWKYTYLSHRMIAMEAGHACQNLCLAAEAIEAGACPMLAYHQPAVDSLIGVDGQDEFAIYLACVGKLPE